MKPPFKNFFCRNRDNAEYLPDHRPLARRRQAQDSQRTRYCRHWVQVMERTDRFVIVTPPYFIPGGPVLLIAIGKKIDHSRRSINIFPDTLLDQMGRLVRLGGVSGRRRSSAPPGFRSSQRRVQRRGAMNQCGIKYRHFNIALIEKHANFRASQHHAVSP